MLLGWDGVELVGVTTNTDPGGRQAGYAAYALTLGAREDVRILAGAQGTLAFAFPEYWPEPIPARPSRAGAAIEALAISVEAGATIVAIGPSTNLAMLEMARPGSLGAATIVVMGGHMTQAREGYPPVGVHEDFNVQQDRVAASIVLRAGWLLVLPVSITVEVALREAHLPRLRAGDRSGD